MNTRLNTFSELSETLNKYWKENALHVIPRWTFREPGTDTPDERISNPILLKTKIEFKILRTLAEGQYPFFEIDTEYTVISFRKFDNLNDIYKRISPPSDDPTGIVFPDIITVKTFTQGTTFFWLY